MSQHARAFTLIELLLVISIIVLLMALLAPAMTASIQAVKIKDTEQRITMIHKAVLDYHAVYAAYPPDTSPDREHMNKNSNDAYAAYTFPDGSEPSYIFNHGWWNDHPYGGKFLAYFLMGPRAGGWHRPKNPGDTRDPYYRCKYITAEWDVPIGLVKYLDNEPVSQGASKDYVFPVFVDAFGLMGYNGGTIGYGRADSRRSGMARWPTHAWSPAFYWDCRSHPSYPGDGKGGDHLKKIQAQCPYDFMLLSPGPNAKFGYRVYGMMHKGEYLKGSWSDLANGIIDDVANFPLK